MLLGNKHFNAINQAFPHIGAKLRTYWGHAEFVRYMHSLLHDTRDGKRKGFPFDVLMSLHSLSDLHREEFPTMETVDEIWSMGHPHLR